MADISFTPGIYMFKYDPSLLSRDISLEVAAVPDEATIKVLKGDKVIARTSVFSSDPPETSIVNMVDQFTKSMTASAEKVRIGRDGVTKAVSGADIFNDIPSLADGYNAYRQDVNGGNFKLLLESDVAGNHDAMIEGKMGLAAKSGGPLQDTVASALGIVSFTKKIFG